MSACGSSREPLVCRCMGLRWGEFGVSRATTSGLTTRDKPKSAIFTEQSTQDTNMFAATEDGCSRNDGFDEVKYDTSKQEKGHKEYARSNENVIELEW